VVTIVELELSAISDEEGNVYFENVPAGTYTLKITAVTYMDVTLINIVIEGGGEVNLEIPMNPDES
jgi:hypothetical protein